MNKLFHQMNIENKNHDKGKLKYVQLTLYNINININTLYIILHYIFFQIIAVVVLYYSDSLNSIGILFDGMDKENPQIIAKSVK
jgi:hypothetical protein